MPTCPVCQKNTAITITKGPGRKLGAYAETPEGAHLEIPAEVEIPKCECGTLVLSDSLKSDLRAYEQLRTPRTFPIL